MKKKPRHKPSRSIKKWFELNDPWCPLFGIVPMELILKAFWVDKHFINRCLQNIEDARELWNIRNPLDLPPFSTSWPDPDDAPWIAKGELLTARGIFWHVLDIFSASQIFNPSFDPDQIKDSEILWHARSYGRSFKGAKEIEAYKTFAIFSIFLAWDSLDYVFSKEENSDSPMISKNLLLAESFLNKAQRLSNWSREKEAEINIRKEIMRERGRRSGELRKLQNEAKFDWPFIHEIAAEIRRKRPSLSNSDVARIIHDRLQEEIRVGHLIPKQSTIRKKIRKTSIPT